ncbi:MAG: type II secretion system protein [Thermodesulfobacteriota bacterium]|nr:type II secretion system protein [Thermodesulfobacteriota bacterium]
MTRTHEKAKAKGFTLIELAIVLVIIGILVSAAGIGWYSLLEGRKLAKTYGTLVQAKECLIKRMLYSNQYPSYTANLDCDTPGGFDLSASDVDACICNLRDAWGQRLYYLEGVNGTTADGFDSLAGFNVTDNPAQNQNATKELEESEIRGKDYDAATNPDTVKYVAFVLISSGKNLTLDHVSYRKLFAAGHVGVIDPTDSDHPPDFSAAFDTTPAVGDAVRDDIYLCVTGPELMTLLVE